MKVILKLLHTEWPTYSAIILYTHSLLFHHKSIARWDQSFTRSRNRRQICDTCMECRYTNLKSMNMMNRVRMYIGTVYMCIHTLELWLSVVTWSIASCSPGEWLVCTVSSGNHLLVRQSAAIPDPASSAVPESRPHL